MNKAMAGLALALAAETAAMACSCVAPEPLQRSRAAAREAVGGAAAVVEVDVISGYDPSWRQGERLRVRQVLFGRAPRTLEVYRVSAPSSAACDLELGPQQRRTLIIYPAQSRFPWRPRYRIQSLCSAYLTDPPYLPITLQEARRRR